MNFTYENQGTSAFLVYPLNAEDQLDTMGIGMISNNHIPHILPISFTQIDEARYLRYSISSKITLESFFSGMVTRKRLLGIFIGICEAIEAGDEYMLESSMLVLDKKYIFANVSTGEPYLVYLPVLDDREPLDLGKFFKEIMFGTQFDPSEDCSYVAGIINFLNTSTHFSLKEFETLLYKLKDYKPGQEAPAPKKQMGPPSGAAPKPVEPPATEPKTPPQKVVVPPMPKPNSVVTPPSAVIPPVIPKPAVPASASPKENKKGGAFEEKKGTFKGIPEFAIPGQEDKNGQNPAPVQPKPATEGTEKKKGLFGFGAKKAQGKQTPASAPVVPMTPPAPSSGFVKAEARTPDWAGSRPVSPNAGQTTTLQGISPPTVVLSPAAGATTVLSNHGAPDMPAPRPVLVRSKTGEVTVIDKILFRIGTEQSFANLWISDNSAVSHAHADIINHEGNYFVRDNNSTNHTYLNGTQLVSNQEYQLESGDELVFANERFLFEIK